jgi:hypothetical protein
LLCVLVLSAIFGLKVSAQHEPSSPFRNPGQAEQDRFHDKEISEILFGSHLERDMPVYYLEDRHPTPELESDDRCQTPPVKE